MKSRGRIFFIVATILLLTFISAGASFAQLWPVGGQVTDIITGVGIDGAIVTFTNQADFQSYPTMTAMGGYYGYAPGLPITGLPAGSYMVAIVAEGYSPFTDFATVVMGANEFNFQLTLAPQQLANVGGMVTDATTLLPIIGATVQFGEYTTTTVATPIPGGYAFIGIPVGDYPVTITMPGYQIYTDNVTLVEGDNLYNAALAPEVAEQFGNVGGQITDAETGLPIVGAQVYFNNFNTVTVFGGLYGIANLPVGVYNFMVMAEGYEIYNQEVTVIEGENVFNAALTPAGEIPYTLTYLTFFDPYMNPGEPILISQGGGETVQVGETFVVPDYDLTDYPMLGTSFTTYMNGVSGTQITVPEGAIDQNVIVCLIMKGMIVTPTIPMEILGIWSPDPRLEGQLWSYTEYQVYDQFGNRLNEIEDFYFNDPYRMEVIVPLDDDFWTMMLMMELPYDHFAVAYWLDFNWDAAGIDWYVYYDEQFNIWLQYLVRHLSEIAGGPDGGFGEQGDETITVPLRGNYFEMVSTYVTPHDMRAEDVFGGIDGLLIVYQSDGHIFLPGMVNTIRNINPTQGYRIFTDTAGDWVVTGRRLDPETEYFIDAGPWNWIGYPFGEAVPVTTALGHIADHIRILQSDEGGFWIPSIPINTLGNLQPGHGYMTIASEDVTFTYNPTLLLSRGSENEVIEMPVVEGAPQATGLPYAVLVGVTEELRANGASIIELYDGGLLVGKTLVSDKELTPMVAWGGSTEQNLPGFTTGHFIRVSVLNEAGEQMAVEWDSDVMFGEGAYATISVEAAALPETFAVGKGYPNPFNPSITVPFSVPQTGEVIFSVYNLLGQKVFTSNAIFNAGQHRFVFEATSNGSDLVTGVYFLNVQYNGQTSTQKIMLLK